MTKEWKMAVRRGSIEDLERLVAAGADIDARDEHGHTALMQAAVHGHAQVVEWLVRHGAELDHTAKYGLSALMLAVVNGHVAIVQILVRAGAKLGLKGTGAPGFAGKTALDLAQARGDRDLTAILEHRRDEGRH
jgi:ankyrin repeat protein